MDYYEVLEVPKDADAAMIKKAYRKKSRQNHPDRGGDSRAMVWVNKAYETLSDPDKRAYYDACGSDKPLTSLEHLARSVLIQCALQSAAESPKNINLVSSTSSALSNFLARTKQEVNGHKEAKEKFLHHSANILCEGEVNELQQALLNQGNAMEGALQALQRRIEAIEKALEMLKKYRTLFKDSGMQTSYLFANLGINKRTGSL